MTRRTPIDASKPGPYHAWLASALEGEGAPRRQHPADELLAEHHIMGAVLGAMREEAGRLRRNEPLRPRVWSRAVDFIGNFIHRVHRVKEEQILFPVLWDLGLMQEEGAGRLHRQHELLHGLTISLCEGVSNGDWELTMRVVGRYVDLMGPHLAEEEESLVADATRSLEAGRVAELRAAFDLLEAERLPPKGRIHYLEIARTLCEDTDVAHGLEP